MHSFLDLGSPALSSALSVWISTAKARSAASSCESASAARAWPRFRARTSDGRGDSASSSFSRLRRRAQARSNLPSSPAPGGKWAAAWTDSGLLAAVFALVIGAVGFVIVSLWWAFWAFSLAMHAAFWELTDWSKFAMGPDLWHIPVAAALGALVAFASGKVFGYDGRRMHPVILYTGLTAVVMVVVAAMLRLSGRTEDDS